MNGSWEEWGGYQNNTTGTTDGPTKYVKAWKRMHDIFVAHGATNAVWVWSPNCNDVPKDSWNHWTNYYPGDDYVDWVGCDGYNFGGSGYIEWATRYGGTPSVYNDYPQKPFSASETGSCELGTDKGAWITRAHDAIKTQFPRLKLFTWFDEDKSNAGECDWRVNSSQGALDAFRALAADPYFQGG
jgi:beta-mannanase